MHIGVSVPTLLKRHLRFSLTSGMRFSMCYVRPTEICSHMLKYMIWNCSRTDGFLSLLLSGAGDWDRLTSVQFSPSVTCLILCDPVNRSPPRLPVHHQLQELAQTHVHWVGDAIQPSHPLSSPSPPIFNLSQHRWLFQWVSSSNQVAKVSEFQLQHQSFQGIFRTDLL